MQVILRLVRDANIYMNDKTAEPSLQVLESVARWVTKIVGILGLDAGAQPPYTGLGWAAAASTAHLDPRSAVQPYAAAYATVKADVQALNLSEPSLQTLLAEQAPDAEFEALEEAGERDVERLALPYLRATSRLRDALRALVGAAALEPAAKQAVLVLSDRIRDYDLTDLGVQLDDQTDKPSLIKFVPAAKLVAAREEKAALLAEKARAKEEGELQSLRLHHATSHPQHVATRSYLSDRFTDVDNHIARKAREKAEEEKWAKAKVAPQDMFKGDAKYAEWDADGLPTRLADGGEVPKSQGKKLRKDWERQKKLHDEYRARFGAAA